MKSYAVQSFEFTRGVGNKKQAQRHLVAAIKISLHHVIECFVCFHVKLDGNITYAGFTTEIISINM